jgi:hypothetical protein
MRVKSLRRKCVSAKVTEAEYQTFQRLADSRSVSEWIRGVLLDHVTQRSIEEVVLAEFVALRTILLNLQFAVAAGTPPTADEMRQWIEHADEDRFRKAQERRTAAALRSPW